MLVCVTGGTGFLGSHTVAALAAGGARIRLLVRDRLRLAPALGPLGVDPDTVETVTGDVADGAAAARAVRGADAVIHLGSVYSFDRRRRDDITRTNVAGTEAVLEAAVRAGAGTVLYVSTVGALIPTTDSELRAESPVGDPGEPYLASKAACETLARRHQDDGAPVHIVYPPALLGPDDPGLGDQTGRLRDALRGLMPLWPTGGFPLGDVRDTAAVLGGLALGPPPDKPVRVFGPNRYVTTADYLAQLRAATGRRLTTLRLPGRAMLPAARVTDAVQRWWPWHIPAEFGAAYTCVHAVPVSRAATADVPTARPVATTMADTANWLYRTGMLTRRQAGTAGERSGS
ncbi:NAD-dependent epimerase/dehydratase family protein [Streptomyces sp. SID4913]|nr:NAD-dependent epimerase/dehydratase family protein [Streptomyces sp. SID4913]MYY05253.1 NAD-dependent epimerase/dehydratase family protein [Streptomyces sp. SID4913]